MTNRVVHFDIPISDSDRANRFYRDVFGWKTSRWGPVDYWSVTTGPSDAPGIDGALSAEFESPDGVVVYVAVEDIDAALARVADAGGTVLTGKREIPAVGWNALFRDSEGNLIGLFEEAAAEPPAGLSFEI